MVTTTKAAKATKAEVPEMPEKKWFSADDLIDAWENGRNEFRTTILQQFQKNLNLSQNLSVKVLESLQKDVKVKCKSIHLKNDGLDYFEALFIVPESAFLDFTKYSKMNDLVYEVISSYDLQKVDFSFSFMTHNKNINHNAMIADGYRYSYKNA